MTLDGNVSGESCWLCSVTKLSTSKWAMRGGLPDGPSMLAFGHRASAEAKDAQASTYACGPITPNSGKPAEGTVVRLSKDNAVTLTQAILRRYCGTE
jgi:hypothetical protein